MSTLKGMTMHPRCRHIGACWDLLEWFQLFGTSQNSISNVKNKKSNKIQVKIQFQTFLKKIKFLGFHGEEWRPFHWCINYQCRTDIDETKKNSALRHKSTFNFRLFWKKNLGFYAVVLVKTFSLMYQLLM